MKCAKEEKLKVIAKTAEKIKSASQQKIRHVQERAEKAEKELKNAQERLFNIETEVILLKDDSRNLEALRMQYKKLRRVLFTVQNFKFYAKIELCRPLKFRVLPIIAAIFVNFC